MQDIINFKLKKVGLQELKDYRLLLLNEDDFSRRMKMRIGIDRLGFFIDNNRTRIKYFSLVDVGIVDRIYYNKEYVSKRPCWVLRIKEDLT